MVNLNNIDVEMADELDTFEPIKTSKERNTVDRKIRKKHYHTAASLRAKKKVGQTQSGIRCRHKKNIVW